MIGCLTQAADFQRLLATSPRERSAHFVVHHVHATPAPKGRKPSSTGQTKLSTGDAPPVHKLVDESPEGCWLGCVVPKRHARRAVTRSLLKRQMRWAMKRREAHLSPGLWLLRLRQPFASNDFPSAASPALRAAARLELDRLLERAAP